MSSDAYVKLLQMADAREVMPGDMAAMILENILEEANGKV